MHTMLIMLLAASPGFLVCLLFILDGYAYKRRLERERGGEGMTTHTKEEVLAMAKEVRGVSNALYVICSEYRLTGVEEALIAYAALLRDGPVGWQTIETAPRDGTEILTRGPSGVFQSHWVDEPGGGYNPTWWARYTMLSVQYGEFSPTQWMPLPLAPPQENE